MQKSKIPSPARSQEAPVTPRRYKTRGPRSVGSTTPSRLSAVIDQYTERPRDSLPLSPLQKTVLNDETDIEQPRRTSWWKKVNNSRDVTELLDGNMGSQKDIIEDAEVEILSQDKKNFSLDLPESSDSESIHSIVMPQRKLFPQKENKPQNKPNQEMKQKEVYNKNLENTLDLPESSGNESIGSIVIPQRRLFVQKENKIQKRFGQVINKRKSLTKPDQTKLSDKPNDVAPKELSNQVGKSTQNISSDKTLANKTKDLSIVVQAQPRSLFGNRPATNNKRKNMFAAFVVSESEDEISDIQPTLFAFQKNKNPVRHSSSKGLREPSPTSSKFSITTDIEMDDWKLLPSSTMVEHQLEAMVIASSPAKRTRLSKLSEAKESGTTINTNNTADKTKQSNKSITSKNNSKLSKKEDNEEDTSLSKRKSKTFTVHKDSRKTSNKNFEIKEETQQINKEQIHTEGTDDTRNKTRTLNKSSNDKLPSNQELINETETNRSPKLDIESEEEPHDEVELDNNEPLVYQDDYDDEVQSESEFGNKNSTNNLQLSKEISENKDTEIENHSNVVHDECDKQQEQGDQNTMEGKQNERDVNRKDNEKDVEKKENELLTKEIANKDSMDKAINYKDDEQGRNVDMDAHDHDNEDDIQLDENNEHDSNIEASYKDKQAQIENDEDEEKEENECVQPDENNMEEDQGQEDEEQVEKDEEQEYEDQGQADEDDNHVEVRSVEVENSENNLENQNEEGEEEIDEVRDKTNQEDDNEMRSEIEQDKENEENGQVQQDKDMEEIEQDIQNEVEEQDDSDEENEEVERDEDIEQDEDVAEVEQVIENETEEQNENDEENEEVELDEENEEAELDEENEEIELDEDNEEVELDEDNEEVERDEDEEMEQDDVEDVEQDIENESVEVDESEKVELDEENEEEQHEKENVESEQGEHDDDSNQDQDDTEEELEQDNVQLEQDAQDDTDQEQEDTEEEIENQEPESEIDNDDIEDSEAHTDSNVIHNTDPDVEERQRTVIEEEISNKSHDTTGRHRKKINTRSPEIHEKTNNVDSFIGHGRNTSIRKTKSILSIRPSMAPPRDSTGFSEGTRNSSAEGSGWDSHRNERKTLRQTFGRDFTPRKSLRALVMEKSAKRRTIINEANAELRLPQANSTELPAHIPDDEDNMVYEDDVDVAEESNHEVSIRTRQATLEMFLQKRKQDNETRKLQIERQVKESLYGNTQRVDFLNRAASKSTIRRPGKSTQIAAKKRSKPTFKVPLEDLPPEMMEDLNYKPPKRFKASSASWITKRLYKFLETKLEPKYDYKSRVRAEKLVETIYEFTREIKRVRIAPPPAVAAIAREMARLDIVKTHFEFYDFVRDYLPMEIKIKIVPDIVNNIPLPRNGIFANILSEEG